MTQATNSYGADLTPWFHGSVEPVYYGVYQVFAWGREWYSFWDGMRWGFCERTPKEARAHRIGATDREVMKWRGLSRKPR